MKATFFSQNRLFLRNNIDKQQKIIYNIMYIIRQPYAVNAETAVVPAASEH